MIVKDVAAMLGPGLDYTRSVSVRIQDGVFGQIGTHLSPYTGEEVVDGRGLLMAPGLINCHTHVGDSIAKDVGLGADLEGRVHPVYGIKSRILARTQPEHLASFMRAACMAMVRRGITTFVDFREGGPAGVALLQQACSGIHIRCMALGRPTTPQETKAASCNIPLDERATSELDVMGDVGIGISGANESSDAALMTYSNVKGIRAIHAAESEQTRTQSCKLTGRGEVERALQMRPHLLVHMTCATPSELQAARHTSGIVACPRSNAMMSDRLPDIHAMLKAGCQVALGTDNVMINTPDMFSEMEFAWKAAGMGRLGPHQVLTMATSGAATMLGLNTGSITPGMSADYILVDTGHMDMGIVHDPHAALVHRVSAESIRLVSAGGEVAYEQA